MALRESRMLPGTVYLVVIVFVYTVDALGHVGRLVVIDGPALVGRPQILVDEAREHRVLGQVSLDAIQHVFPGILQEHLAVVLEEVLGVCPYRPSLALEVEAHVPRTQLVAFRICIIAIADVVAAGNQCMPKGLEPVRQFLVWVECGKVRVVSTVPEVPGFAAELGTHLQACRQRERELLGVADAYESGLGVVERVGRPQMVGASREVALPTVVGEHAVCDVRLQGQPVFCPGDDPEVGQFEAYLGDGACIDAVGHAAAREQGILHLHGALLLPHGQAYGLELEVAVGLLQDEVAVVVHGTHQVESVSDAPMSQAVGADVALDAGPNKAAVGLGGPQSVSVVGKPEWGHVATACRTLQGGLILYVVSQAAELCVQG